MAKAPSSESKDQAGQAPAPEVLSPRSDDGTPPPQPTDGAKGPKRLRRATYRPSHKATFISLAVVAGILAVNAGIIGFVLHAESKAKTQADQGQVTISQGALSKLGVNRSPVGDQGVQLVVNPDAKFNGGVVVGGDVSIGGQLKLNNTFSANSASLTQLQAGNTSLNSLNVNGDGTVSNLSLRGDLQVAGTSHFQGPVTLSQLLTVNSSVNVAANLAVGGTLSVAMLHASNLAVDGVTTIGGHIITSGYAPGLSRGSALRSTDSISNSGNDMSGSVAVNIGAGSVSGCVATINFRTAYSNVPHVVITPVGFVQNVYLCGRSASGFTIGVGSQSGSVVFDYIIEQ